MSNLNSNKRSGTNDRKKRGCTGRGNFPSSFVDNGGETFPLLTDTVNTWQTFSTTANPTPFATTAATTAAAGGEVVVIQKHTQNLFATTAKLTTATVQTGGRENTNNATTITSTTTTSNSHNKSTGSGKSTITGRGSNQSPPTEGITIIFSEIFSSNDVEGDTESLTSDSDDSSSVKSTVLRENVEVNDTTLIDQGRTRPASNSPGREFLSRLFSPTPIGIFVSGGSNLATSFCTMNPCCFGFLGAMGPLGAMAGGCWGFWRMENRFDQVDNRFDEMDTKFDAVDKRFDKLESRMDNLEVARKALIFRKTPNFWNRREVVLSIDEIRETHPIDDTTNGGEKLLGLGFRKACKNKPESNPFSFPNDMLEKIDSGIVGLFVTYLGRPIPLAEFLALDMQSILMDIDCRIARIEIMAVEIPNDGEA